MTAPGSSAPSTADPSTVTAPTPSTAQNQQAPSSTVFSSNTSLTAGTNVSSPGFGVQSFNLIAPTQSTPSNTHNSSNTPSSTVSSSAFNSSLALEAPVSVLPPAMISLNAAAVNAPSSVSVPVGIDPTTITMPGSGVPGVGPNPSSNPTGVTPPTASNPNQPVVPPVSGPVTGVKPPTSPSDPTVGTMGAWEDFLKWLADQIEQAKNLQDEEAKKRRAQAAATGDPDRVLATNLRLAARDEIYTTYGGKDSQVAKDFRVVAEEVDRLPPAEQIKFWNNLLYNVYQFNVTPGPVGPNNVVKTMLAQMAGDARGRKGAYKSADELWSRRGVPGYTLNATQQQNSAWAANEVSKGVPSWAVKTSINAGLLLDGLKSVWDNTDKPLLIISGGLLVIVIGGIIVGTGTLVTGAGGAAAATITLYRGINSSHPGYQSALQGIVNPNAQWWKLWVRQATPLEHNTVGGATLGSPFTSWTTNFEVAKTSPFGPMVVESLCRHQYQFLKRYQAQTCSKFN